MIVSKYTEACEIFAAAWCNLDCKYCYIPKTNAILPEHVKLIKEIKEITPIINKIKKIFGTNLKYLSHWGSEPTLTIKEFIPFYKVAMKEFPNLEHITFSSNFLSKSKIIDLIDFMESFNEYDRKMTFQVQMSLDGPSWITDNNRRGGATKDILANVIMFTKKINDLNLSSKIRINTHFKPTITKENFKDLLDDKELFEYYNFFNNVSKSILKANHKNKIYHSHKGNPTIVCPDDYTQQDGFNFSKLHDKVMNLTNIYQFEYIDKPDLDYYHIFKKIIFLQDEYFTKHRMFVCSAGDSQMGLNDYVNPCHDTFYHNFDFYKNSNIEDDDRIHSKHDLLNSKLGRIDIAAKYTEKISTLTSKKYNKYEYKLRAFHDFVSHKLTYSVGIIKEMAYVGQVSKCYKHDDMATLLALYTLTRHQCMIRQVNDTGSIHLIRASYFKLFGNGLVEGFLKRFYNEFKGYN